MWEGITRKLRLEVEESWVFVKKPAMSRVRWETTPLFVADEQSEGGAFPSPAFAVTHSVLLSFFFFITVPTNGAGVGRGVGS